MPDKLLKSILSESFTERYLSVFDLKDLNGCDERLKEFEKMLRKEGMLKTIGQLKTFYQYLLKIIQIFENIKEPQNTIESLLKFFLHHFRIQEMGEEILNHLSQNKFSSLNNSILRNSIFSSFFTDKPNEENYILLLIKFQESSNENAEVKFFSLFFLSN